MLTDGPDAQDVRVRIGPTSASGLTIVALECSLRQPAPTQWVAIGVLRLADQALPGHEWHRMLTGVGRTEQAALDDLVERVRAATGRSVDLWLATMAEHSTPVRANRWSSAGRPLPRYDGAAGHSW